MKKVFILNCSRIMRVFSVLRHGEVVCVYSMRLQSGECEILSFVPMALFRKKAKLAIVLYYGYDNYIGEDSIDLKDYATIEMTEQSLTVFFK